MGNYFPLFIVAFLFIIIPIVLYEALVPQFRQNKLLNGVVNYDAFMRKFVFRIDLNKVEFFSILSIHNVGDVLEYILNEDESTITFVKFNAKTTYRYELCERENFLLLKVKRIGLDSTKNITFLLMNSGLKRSMQSR